MKTAKKAALVIAAAGAAIGAAPGAAFADTGASGQTTGSWGIGSGNVVQAPVNAPVNVCGTTANVAGLFNPAAGNSCGDAAGGARTSGSEATPLAATTRSTGGAELGNELVGLRGDEGGLGADAGPALLRGDESGLGAGAGDTRLRGDAEGLGLDSGLGEGGETRLLSNEAYEQYNA
ncbi:chaplin [Streptomyces albus]|uniref:chaplin n=1 Tax=Streptomyces albus TaxID=1888 RepID=UPI00099C3B3A|nr:chaplin [Streptomyces albus]